MKMKVNVVYTDYIKAFDTIDHVIISSKPDNQYFFQFVSKEDYFSDFSCSKYHSA